MFIQTRPVKMYSVKFITDLAIRSGHSSENGICPKRGMNDVVQRYFSKETVASWESLFERQLDFDADKIKPQLSKEYVEDMSLDEFKDEIKLESCSIQYDPSIHKLDFNAYYRRIEDIHAFYLESYLGNIVFNIRNRSGGIKDFDKDHKEAYAFISDGDDGEEITESADLLVGAQVDMSDVANVQEAMLYLPYTVKRLWCLSAVTKINVLSYIKSYLIAKRSNEIALQTKSTTAYLKSNDVIRVGVWACNEFGVTMKQVQVENKNKHAAEMFDWITGHSTKYVSFYRDYRNFLIYCSVLNIDIANDDMLSYDKDFIKKLVIKTVTPNDQYDMLVAEAIKTGGVNTDSVPNPGPTQEDAIINTMRVYNDFILSSTRQQQIISNMSSADRDTIEKAALSIFIKYKFTYHSEHIEMSKVTWCEGFMYYKDDVVLIPLDFVHPNLAVNSPQFNYGMFHDTGVFVMVSPSYIASRTMLLDVFNYIQSKGTFVEATIPKWEQVTL